MRKRAMHAILGTVAFRVGFVNASGCFVVSQVVAFLGVARVTMHVRTLVRVGTYARLFVVFVAVSVGIVVECAVTFAQRSSAALIFKVPIETCVRSVLSAFVLQEK